MAPGVSRTRPRASKIVVTGPVDAGKTTFVRTISDVSVVSTEREVTGPGGGTTTVAMDFGHVSLGEGLSVSLFGTPGQRRFDFMWDVVAEGMLGFVLMVDGSRADDLGEARRIRAHFTALADVPHVVALNKVPAAVSAPVAQVRSGLGLPADVPVVVADARSRADVKRVLVRLLEVVRDRLAAPPATRTTTPAPGARR